MMRKNADPSGVTYIYDPTGDLWTTADVRWCLAQIYADRNQASHDDQEAPRA